MDKSDILRYHTLGATLRVAYRAQPNEAPNTIIGRVFSVEDRAAQFEYLDPALGERRYLRLSLEQIGEVTDVTSDRLYGTQA